MVQWNSSYKKMTAAVSVMTCCFSLTLGAALPLKAEAFNLAGVLIGSAVQYSYFNKQLNYYDNEGREEYFDQIKKREGVNEDPALNASLDRIMSRLSSSIAETDESVVEKPYNYFVNSQTTFNAFCTLGHNLSVNTGLFSLLNGYEDEIAFVVAHEMAHGQKNHPIEGFKKSVPFDLLVQIYNARGDGGASDMAVGVLANYATATSVTKPQEWEADNIAFDYATRAGYNPGAGASVWQRVIEKMGESSSNFVGEIFSPSDHPKNQERRDNYAKKLAEYSGQNVTVGAGVIKIKGKTVIATANSDAMSGLERSYLIAGNLAAVYHNNQKIPAAYVEGGMVKMGVQPIILPIAGEPSAQALADLLNAAK